MSYTLQNFTSGEVLFASRLNNMDQALKNAFEEQDAARNQLLADLTPEDVVEENMYVASIKIEEGKIKTEKVEIPDFVLTETYNGVVARVDTIENQLSVLEGDGEGSIEKQIADNIAKVLDDAPEKFDTLKEVAEWIETDTTNSTQLINRVAVNETSILETKGRVSNLEGQATLLISSINEAKNGISALTTEYKQADETLKNDLTESIKQCKSDCEGYTDSKIDALNTVYDVKDSAKTAEQNAKNYVDQKMLEINTDTYATKAWVAEQNYLTEHQSLAEYIKASEFHAKDNIYTKAEIQTLLQDYVLQTALSDALERIASLEAKIAALEDVKDPEPGTEGDEEQNTDPENTPENPTEEPIE